MRPSRQPKRRLCSALAVASLLVLTPSYGAAQELDTVLTVSSGTGISLGKAESTIKKRSPLFLEIDLGLIFDGDGSLEWTPSLLVEFEGRVSVGVNPSVKRVKRWGRFAIYGGLGFPVFVAPFTLWGAEVGVGGFFTIIPRRLALSLELRADVFFAGSDLPDGTAVVKFDFALGVRMEL